MSESQIPKEPIKVVVGGSVEHSLAGKASLEPFSLLKEAFIAGRKTRLSLGIAFLAVLGCVMLLGTLISPLSRVIPLDLVLNLVQLLITPLIAGLYMMGINIAVGIKPRMNQVFDQLPRFAPLLQAMLAMLLMQWAMLVILQVMGLSLWIQAAAILLYLLLVGFTLPLIVDKGLNPFKALKLSAQVCLRYLPQLLLTNLGGWLLVAVGFVPLLREGLDASQDPGHLYEVAASLFLIFIAIPYYFTLQGVLYRQLFGVKVAMTRTDPTGIFGA